MSKYWFARRFPVSEVNANRMAPVSREGWLVVWGFVACEVLGALAFVVASFVYREPAIGLIVFLILSGTGMTAFLALAMQKGDRLHTLDDYRAGRVGGA